MKGYVYSVMYFMFWQFWPDIRLEIVSTRSRLATTTFPSNSLKFAFLRTMHDNTIKAIQNPNPKSLMIPLLSACITCWTKRSVACDFRRHDGHRDVIRQIFTLLQRSSHILPDRRYTGGCMRVQFMINVLHHLVVLFCFNSLTPWRFQ